MRPQSSPISAIGWPRVTAPSVADRVAAPAYLPLDPCPGQGHAAGREIPAAPVVAVFLGLGQASVVRAAEGACLWFLAGSGVGCFLAQAGSVVEPAGSGLAAAPPPGP